MKINFENEKDYIEIIKTDKISIIISARDSLNSRKSIINSVNLTEDQLINLIESIGLELTKS